MSEGLLGAKAQELGLSGAELVEHFAAMAEAEELRALVDAVNRAVPDTLRIADETHRRVDQLLGNSTDEQRVDKSNHTKGAPRSPHKLDVHIGQRVAARRRIVALTEEEASDALGISRLQLEQFERGARRIGPAQLLEFSQLLNVPVSYFFDATDPAADRDDETKLVHSFFQIRDAGSRRLLLRLARALAADEAEEVTR